MDTTRSDTGDRGATKLLTVRCFAAQRDPQRYARFHEIRTSVFAEELGWHLSEPHGVWRDPFDRGANLFIAETSDDAAVGILRAQVASVGFPHRELFAQDLVEMALIGRDAVIGTMNALAVRPFHRGRQYRSTTSAAAGTAAHLLLASALAHLESRGVRVVFATVLGAKSARSFLRVGFRFLSPPHGMPGQERFIVANVGAVLPAALAEPAEWVVRSRAQLAVRHRQVVAMGSVEELFGQRTPVSSGV